MKKWLGSLISLFLVIAFWVALGPFSGSSGPTEQVAEISEAHPIQLNDKGEREGNRGEADPHLIQILKILRERIEEWVKSLDERIESEDITRFEVRFLEILRNILAWVKEKLDAKITSSEEKKPGKKGRGVFQETRENLSTIGRLC